MPTPIDSLSVSISANAKSAENAINRLASTLSKLSGAVSSIDLEGAISRIRTLSDALRNINGSKLSSSVPKNIEKLGNTIAAISERDVSKLERIAAAVQQMNGATVNFSGVSFQNPTQAVTENVGDTSPIASGMEEVTERTEEYSRSAFSAVSAAKAFNSAVSLMFRPVVSAAGAVKGFVTQLMRVAKMRFLRWIVKTIVAGFKEGITNLYHWSNMVDKTFKKTMDALSTSFLYLKNSIGAMVAPLIEMLAPAIEFIIDKVVDLLNWFNQLFATLSGAETYTAAKKMATVWDDTSKDVKKNAEDTAKDIKKTILGFDEINKLTKPTSSSSSSSSSKKKDPPDYKNMFEERAISGGFKGFSNAINSALEGSLSQITKILGFAPLAVGAILTLSGANVPLGLGLMGLGAVTVFGVAQVSGWSIPSELMPTIYAVESALIGAELAIGAVLTFSGANVPLGLGLLAIGAVTLGSAISLQWGTLINSSVGNVANNIAAIVSAASLAIGAVLAFTGVNLPLGIGMMAAGIMGTAVSLKWGSLISGSIDNTLRNIIIIVSSASLVLGALLAFTGVNVPLGVGLIAAGVVGTAASLKWGTAVNGSISNTVQNIIHIVSEASLALGAILTFTGINVPLGIGLMAAGAVGIAATINWDTITNKLVGPLLAATLVVSAALLVLGILLILNPVTLPLGLGLVAAGAVGLATSVAARWDDLKEIGSKAIKKVKEGWDTLKDTAFTFVANVVNTAAKWYGNVKAWWKEKLDSGKPLESISIDVYNKTSEWMQSIKGWWAETSENLKVNVAPKLLDLAGKAVGAVTSFWNWLFPKKNAEEEGKVDIELGVDDTNATEWFEAFSKTVAGVSKAVSDAWTSITSWTSSSWLTVQNAVGNAWSSIQTKTSLVTETVGKWVDTKWTSIKTWTTEKWDNVSTKISGVWTDVKGYAQTGVDVVGNLVTTAWSSITGDTNTTWDGVKKKALDTWSVLKSNASFTFGQVKKSVKDAWEKNGIQGVISAFVTWVSGTLSVSWEKAWNGLVETFGSVFDGIRDAAKTPINGVINFLNSMIGKVEWVINKVKKGISDMVKIDIPSYHMPWPFPDTPPIYWKPIGYTETYIPRITPLAEGGILERAAMLTPDIMAGEAGSEAVLPLDRHTEWMNEVADRVNSRDSAARRADEQMIALMRDLLGEMRKFNDKEFSAEITTSGINRAQTRANMRAGTTVSPVGV